MRAPGVGLPSVDRAQSRPEPAETAIRDSNRDDRASLAPAPVIGLVLEAAAGTAPAEASPVADRMAVLRRRAKDAVAKPVSAGEPSPTPLANRLRNRSGVDLTDVRVHREGRVAPTTNLAGLSLTTDLVVAAEADAMSQPAIPRSHPAGTDCCATGHIAGQGGVIQRYFDMASRTFAELLAEQKSDQEAVVGKYSDGEFTTVGFEHEFAQMEKGGPLTGVSHVELAKSTQSLPLTSLTFNLETDADRALELVSPPFVVATLPGTMIPNAQQVRKMERIISARLAILVKDKPKFSALIAEFQKDPGLTFKVDPAVVKPENIGPETTADYHEGANTLGVSAISQITIVPSVKSKGDVTQPDISPQVNFATDLQTYEKVRASDSPKDLGQYSRPYAELEAKLFDLLTIAYGRFVTDLSPGKPVRKLPDSKPVRQYLRTLARSLSQQLAVPSINEARARQEKLFKTENTVTRNQVRNTNADDAAYLYHRKMASHVKDAGIAWIKDTPTNIGLGILSTADWRAVLFITENPDLRAGVNGIAARQGMFSMPQQKVYATCLAEARGLILAALTQLGRDAVRFMKLSPDTRSTTFSQPAQRPTFLDHDPVHIGARQDTYVPGQKVQLPNRRGSRLHVVETRGRNPLQVTDRLHIDHLISTATAELTDKAISDELGHENADEVTAYRNESITARLKEGKPDHKAIADQFRVPQSRVHALQQKIS